MSAVQYFGLITMICVAHNITPSQRTVLGGLSLVLAALSAVFLGGKP